MAARETAGERGPRQPACARYSPSIASLAKKNGSTREPFSERTRRIDLLLGSGLLGFCWCSGLGGSGRSSSGWHYFQSIALVAQRLDFRSDLVFTLRQLGNVGAQLCDGLCSLGDWSLLRNRLGLYGFCWSCRFGNGLWSCLSFGGCCSFWSCFFCSCHFLYTFLNRQLRS